MDAIRGFWNRNVTAQSDDFRSSRVSLPTKIGVAAGWAAAATGVGYAVGRDHGARDVVTFEQIPYAETVQVKVGDRTVVGGFHTHYSVINNQVEYGYDPTWVHTEGVYETQATGRTLHRTETHHTVGFPFTPLQGALVGLGVGVVTGALGLAIYEILKRH